MWCFARSPRSASWPTPSSVMPRASTCFTPAAGGFTHPATPTPPSRRCRGLADSWPTTRPDWRRRCASPPRCSGACTPVRAKSSTCPSRPCWCPAPIASWAGSSPGRCRPRATRDDFDQQGPASFFACADGFVYLYMTSRAHWLGVKALMGHPEWLDEFDDDWLEFSVTPEKVAAFQRGFAQWVRDLAKEAAAEEAQRLGVPLVPVNGAADLHDSPQYRHRGFFREVRHPVLGAAAYPTVPYALSASPAEITSAAPALGQHTDAGAGSTRHPARGAGRQVSTTQAGQRSARRTAGRGARRRADQGVGRSLRGQAAGAAGRRSDQGRNRRPPRGDACLRRHRHQPRAVLSEHQPRDPQCGPRHQVTRGHGAAARADRAQRHRHQQPAARARWNARASGTSS